MNLNMKVKKLSVRELCAVGLFTAVIVVCAQISVPLPGGVPFTLQTFAVALAGVVLGAKKGTMAVVVYILLGAVGAPVFTNFGGGFHRLIGPWGGYLLSFPLLTFVAGLGADRLNNKPGRINTLFLAVFLAAGSVLNLTAGSMQLMIINQLSLQSAFIAGFAPFIVLDMLKMACAFVFGLSARRILAKAGVVQK
jgi:biotin transport system substrate-specific component